MITHSIEINRRAEDGRVTIEPVGDGSKTRVSIDFDLVGLRATP